MSNAILFPAAPGAFLIGAVLFCATASGAEPTPTAESRAEFKAGVSFLDQGRYAEAYRKFKDAYALTPRWTALGNLGIAAEHLERDGEAIDVMVEYLRRGGSEIKAKEAREVRSAIERVQKESASVTLEAVGTFWVVDTRLDGKDPVVNEYGPFDGRAELRVRGGQHEFKLDRSEMVAAAWKVTLIGGDAASHAFESTRPDAELVGKVTAEPSSQPVEPAVDVARGPSHTMSYVFLGVGAAAGVTATIVLLRAGRLQDDANADFRRRCPTGASDVPGCENTTAGDARAANWRTGSLLTGIGAAAALATGAILYLSERSPSGSNDEASLQPWISGTGLGLSGTF